MPVLFEGINISEAGVYEIKQTLTVQVTAEQARRTVNRWLLEQVSDMLRAESPTLVVDDRNGHLQRNCPPIVFVQTGQLPYWTEDAHHAVVVVGMSGNEIFLNDPAIVQAPIAVPLGDFDLAWLERDELYAALTD